MSKNQEITKQPTIMVVIDDLTPKHLKDLGVLLKKINANVILLKRVALSEKGPMGATQARLDLSEANHNLNIPAAQQIVHGLNQSVLTQLMRGPVDAMVVGKANADPTLLVKSSEVDGLQQLMAQMPSKMFSSRQLYGQKSVAGKVSHSIFTAATKPRVEEKGVDKSSTSVFTPR